MTNSGTLIAYFDTNAYGRLCWSDAETERWTPRLKGAIAARRLSILPGAVVFDETFGIQRQPEKILDRLRLMWDLCDWQSVVKSHNLLLQDDIRHFVYNGEADHPFMREPASGRVRASLRNLMNGIGDFDSLRDIVRAEQPRKLAFATGVEALADETRIEFRETVKNLGIRSFDDYLQSQSAVWASALAEKCGLLPECTQKGISELLKLRTVKMCVGHSLSYVWANNMDEEFEVRPSDSADLQHSLPAAAAADVFVTNDAALTGILKRVPLRNFRVMTTGQLVGEIS
jgi:hypothetical protein